MPSSDCTHKKGTCSDGLIRRQGDSLNSPFICEHGIQIAHKVYIQKNILSFKFIHIGPSVNRLSHIEHDSSDRNQGKQTTQP